MPYRITINAQQGESIILERILREAYESDDIEEIARGSLEEVPGAGALIDGNDNGFLIVEKLADEIRYILETLDESPVVDLRAMSKDFSIDAQRGALTVLELRLEEALEWRVSEKVARDILENSTDTQTAIGNDDYGCFVVGQLSDAIRHLLEASHHFVSDRSRILGELVSHDLWLESCEAE